MTCSLVYLFGQVHCICVFVSVSMHVRACLYHDLFPGAFVEAGSVYLYIRICIHLCKDGSLP